MTMLHQLRLATVAAAWVLGAAGPARALPVDWLGEWMVRLAQNDSLGSSGTRRAFGPSVTIDGQVVDLQPDLAFARADAFVIVDGSSSEAQADFSRSLRLAGSHLGWRVALEGLLSGRLAVERDPAGLAGVEVRGSARVLDNAGNFTGLSIVARFDLEDVATVDFAFEPFADDIVLADGVYTLQGLLRTTAFSLPSRTPAPALAQPQFFDGGGGEVRLAAAAPDRRR